MKGILLLPFVFLLVACPKSDDEQNLVSEGELKEVVVEVLSFEYTPDTGNDTNRLQYKIKFTNSNNFDVQGYYEVFFRNGDLSYSRSSISSSENQCNKIVANSDCTFSFDEQDPLDIVSGEIELVSVEYTILEY